jgi:hypothetical protein
MWRGKAWALVAPTKIVALIARLVRSTILTLLWYRSLPIVL